MILKGHDPFTPPTAPGSLPFFPTPEKQSPPVPALSHSWTTRERQASDGATTEKSNPIPQEDQEAIDALEAKTRDTFSTLILEIITSLAARAPATEEQWSSIQQKLRHIFLNEDQVRRKISEVMVNANTESLLDNPFFTQLVKLSRIRLSMVAWTVVNVPEPLGKVENRLNQTMAKAVREANKSLPRFSGVDDALQDPQEEFVRAFKIAAYDLMFAKEGEIPESVQKIQGALTRAENRLHRGTAAIVPPIPQRQLGTLDGNRLHLRLHSLFLKKN